jgi:hypothetical protein
MLRVFRGVEALTGFLFLLAASLKLNFLLALGVMSPNGMEASGLIQSLSIAEFGTGLWLVLGIGGTYTWASVAVIVVGLGAYSLGLGILGYETCGCFGALSVPPFFTATMDAALFLIWLKSRSLFVSRINSSISHRLFCLAAAASIPLILVSAVSLFGPSKHDEHGRFSGTGPVVLDPRSWVGKRCPLLAYVNTSADITTGSWAIVLVHHDCKSCQRLIAQLATDPSGSGLNGRHCRIAIVQVPPLSNSGSIEGDDSQFAVGHLNTDRVWFVQCPVIIVCDDGVVHNVI